MQEQILKFLTNLRHLVSDLEFVFWGFVLTLKIKSKNLPKVQSGSENPGMEGFVLSCVEAGNAAANASYFWLYIFSCIPIKRSTVYGYIYVMRKLCVDNNRKHLIQAYNI